MKNEQAEGEGEGEGKADENEEKEEEPSESEILDAKNKSTEHLFDTDYFQGDPDDSDESDESNEIEENGVLCGEDGERIPVEADQDGQDLSINNLFRRIYIKVVYKRGPEISGPLNFYA